MARNSKQETRAAILAAAQTVLASDGIEALSLSKVAHLAGINRGTAYQHFETRDDLIKATLEGVSERLLSEAFGDIEVDGEGRLKEIKEREIYNVISRLVNFAVENPTLVRIWLFEVLSAEDPAADPFFSMFKQTTRHLSETPFSQEGIDVEALSVIVLAGYFLWPEWVRAHSHTEEGRKAMADRMRREMLRLFLYGVLKTEEFPQLQEMLRE